jgi:RNA polymerase-binding transcription factor DksA
MAIHKKAARDKPRKTTPAAVASKKGGGAKPMRRPAPGKPGAAVQPGRKARPPAVPRKPESASPAVRKPVAARAVQVSGRKSAAPHRPAVKPTAKPVRAPAPRVLEKKRPLGAVKFSKKDLDAFKSQLSVLYDDLAGQIGKMRKNALRRDDEVNVEEDGSDAFDRLFTLERAGTEQETINQITNALRAIREGTYGVCDACGGLVEKARLQALPFVKNCVGCQSEMERHRTRGGVVPRRKIP